MEKNPKKKGIQTGRSFVWGAMALLTAVLTAAFAELCFKHPGQVTVMHISGELFSMFLILAFCMSLSRAGSTGNMAYRQFYRIMMILVLVMAVDVTVWLRYGGAAESAGLLVTLWYLIPMATLAFVYTGLFLKVGTEEARLRENARRFMSAGVAEELMAEAAKDHEAAGMEAAVLFCHIHDFDSRISGEAEETGLRALRYFLGEVSEIVNKHGGTVLSFPGYGVLCMFSASPSLTEASGAAVETALEIRREMENFGALCSQTGLPPMQVGIGIHAGTMYAGGFGNEEQKRYTVIGKAVNEASRIENFTKDGEILVSDEIRKMSGQQFRFGETRKIYPKGIPEGMTVWSVEEGKAPE